MDRDEHLEAFQDLRRYLFSLAYRMVGSVAEAEDVVQDAFLRWEKTPPEAIQSPKSFLSTVVTRLCIDHLRSARSRRETYVGPWLPEPLLTDSEPDVSETAERAESLSLAFLIVLETLSPVERAVFLLREIFGYDYDEIAHIVDKSEANCRQIAHRAKEHVASRRPRFKADRAEHLEVTMRFMEACALGETSGLLELLARDATLWSDGGGRVKAARRPILGPDKVARFVLGILKKTPPGADFEVREVNGRPAIILSLDGEVETVLSLDVAERSIQGIHIVANPEKLRSLSR